MENRDIEMPKGRERRHELPLQLTIFGAWLLAFGAAALLEYTPNASLWFPPAAVTFAAVVVLGLRALPVIWLGCLIVTILADQVYQRGLSWPDLAAAGTAFAFTHTIAYAALGLVFRSEGRQAGFNPGLRSVTWFVIGGLLASAVSSALGGLTMIATGMSEASDIPPLVFAWWIGDYAGLVTIGPLLTLLLIGLSAVFGIRLPAGLERLAGTTGWVSLFRQAAPGLALLTGLTMSVLLVLSAFPETSALTLLLLACLPVNLWLAKTAGAMATLTGVAGFSVLLAAATGPMGLAEHALALQLTVIGLAVASYLGLVRSSHRRKRSAG